MAELPLGPKDLNYLVSSDEEERTTGHFKGLSEE
jgi:hypothetical protein